MKNLFLIVLAGMFSLSLFASEKKMPEKLIIADFNSGKKPSNIGGDFGSWDKNPKDTTQTCLISFSKKERVGKEGYSLRIDYDVDSPNPAWNGAWFKLNKIDVSGYKRLNFYMKGDENKGFTKVLKIELKNGKGEVGKYYLSGITSEWKKFSIPLENFVGISDFSEMEEFVIVFEDTKATKKVGTVYIDEIYFSKK